MRFESFGEDPQAYGYAAGLGLSHTCESEVVAQLVDLQRRAAEYARHDGRIAEDDFFRRVVLQNDVAGASLFLESPR
jgi:hypothetical protein